MLDFAERLERVFELYPGRPAFCIGGTFYSYAELQSRVNAIHATIDQTLDASDRLVGVVVSDALDSYAAVLATLRSGRAFVPLNPEHPPERNASIVAQAGLHWILEPPANTRLADDVIGSARVIHTDKIAPTTVPPMPAYITDELAYLLFTSGSTGEPKGVPITRLNLAAFLDGLAAAGCSMDESDRVLQMFDLTFDFSIASYLAPLASGACVYPTQPGTLKFAEVYRLLSEEKLTVAPMVPSVLTYLRPYFSDINLPDLRLSFFCGEALLADVANGWMECAPASAIVNFYGPTEATVFAMYYDWDPARGESKSMNGVVSIGRAMQDMHVLVVNDDLQEVPVGEQGELCLAGSQVTPGYWQDDDRNRRTFFHADVGGRSMRFYRTGDLAAVDEDGDHLFYGRVDHQIKLQGYRVELGEIEHHVREIIPDHAAVVVPQTNKLGNLELHLVVERYDGELRDVLNALRSRVPPYMVPTRAVTVAHIPLNSNGKIDRRAIARDLESAIA